MWTVSAKHHRVHSGSAKSTHLPAFAGNNCGEKRGKIIRTNMRRAAWKGSWKFRLSQRPEIGLLFLENFQAAEQKDSLIFDLKRDLRDGFIRGGHRVYPETPTGNPTHSRSHLICG
jgi:hypothetical protein